MVYLADLNPAGCIPHCLLIIYQSAASVLIWCFTAADAIMMHRDSPGSKALKISKEGMGLLVAKYLCNFTFSVLWFVFSIFKVKMGFGRKFPEKE